MSEQKQNNQSSGGFRTSIGGQALIRTVEYLLISELAFFSAFWLGKKFEEYMK